MENIPKILSSLDAAGIGYRVNHPGQSITLMNSGNTHEVLIHYLLPDHNLHWKIDSPYNIENAVHFKINLSEDAIHPDFYFLDIGKVSEAKYLIISRGELLERFTQMKKLPNTEGVYDFTLNILPEGIVIDTTNMSLEGEWYTSGGRLWQGSKRDFSQFANNWDSLYGQLNIQSSN